MRNKALLLVTLLIASGSVLAEQDLLGNAGTQLLKGAVTSAAPKEAVESVGAVSQKVEDANKLKEIVKSPTDALKGQAQDMATDAAKEKLEAAVPGKAKESIKTVKKTTKTAKKLTGKVPKSTSEATKMVKDKVQEEATKKALDTLK